MKTEIFKNNKNSKSFTSKWRAAERYAVGPGRTDARNGVTRHEKTFYIERLTNIGR